mgnify:CR=1 FL=1
MFIGSINYKLKDMILEEFVKGFAEQFEDTDITEIQMDTCLLYTSPSPRDTR